MAGRRSAILRILFVLLWSAILALPAAAADFSGFVVRIHDGDTVVVVDGARRRHKIRLAAIDAPERRQVYGQASRLNLAQLVLGRPVAVEFRGIDRYGRELGKLLVAGRDINLEQVRSGMAWHYKAEQDEQLPAERQAYGQAELAARAARRGLWKDASPVPPWDFRHRRGRAR